MSTEKLRELIAKVPHGEHMDGIVDVPDEHCIRCQLEAALAAPRQAEEFDARELITRFLADLEDERYPGTEPAWTIRNLLPLAQQAYAAGRAALRAESESK